MKSGYTIIGEDMSVRHFTAADFADGINSFDPITGDHCHDKYEITYLISASGRYIIEGSTHNVAHGSLAVIRPLSYHKVIFDPDEEIEGYTVYFSKSVLSDGIAEMLDLLSGEVDVHGRFYSRAVLSEALISVFDRFEESKSLKQTERKAYMQALLTEMIILLRASAGDAIINNDDELGARVARYLNVNFRKNICLDRLARRFFVSKYHLCRAFKAYSGISVHAYVNHKRIIYAKTLIESGITASSAAEKVGFGDYSAFYRAYVKIVGRSPTAINQ